MTPEHGMLVMLLLAGCGSALDGDTVDTGVDVACEIEGHLFSSQPENGQAGVFYQTEIQTKIDIFRTPSPEDVAWLQNNLEASLWRRVPDSPDFEAVASTHTNEEVEGRSTPNWQIFPDDRLLGSTSYQARFEWCDDVTTLDFRTGPASDPVSLDLVDGAAFALGLDESEWGAPGLSDVFAELGRDVLIQIDFVAGEPQITFGWSRLQSTEQDVCRETRTGPIWTFDNPWFEGGGC
jgi:hypothetical protein